MDDTCVLKGIHLLEALFTFHRGMAAHLLLTYKRERKRFLSVASQLQRVQSAAVVALVVQLQGILCTAQQGQ